MSEKELSFEELTGTSSVDEWQQENTDAELSKVSAKAQEQLDLEKEIKDLEEQLKETKSRHRAVSELELPEAMQEANLAEIVLTNGAKISVKPFYKGYISEENREDAMAWLVDNNHGSLIKNEVTLKFGKDEDEKAAATVEQLKQQGLDPNVKQGVHPQTLNAFIKEQITGGKDIPSDIFGIYVGSRANIK
tara:strand:- start:4671 stop:5243 length:573 start_codon:yes stop_codon:yes gene_type:complete